MNGVNAPFLQADNESWVDVNVVCCSLHAVTSECQDAGKGGIGGLKDREGRCSNCNWDG